MAVLSEKESGDARAGMFAASTADVPMCGRFKLGNLLADFLVDVPQGRWCANALAHGECETLRVAEEDER
jgi:hypothetical protein